MWEQVAEEFITIVACAFGVAGLCFIVALYVGNREEGN